MMHCDVIRICYLSVAVLPLLPMATVLHCQTGYSQLGVKHDRMLTVEQTYGAVFVNVSEAGDPDLASLGNPEAKEGLIQIAKNAKDPAQCGKAIFILGNICPGEEAKLLLEIVDSKFHGDFKKSYVLAFAGLQKALRRMGERGSEDAKGILKEMTTYDFWKSRFQKVQEEEIDLSSRDICELRIYAMLDYAGTNAKDWKEVAMNLRASLPKSDTSQSPNLGAIYASRLQDSIIERTIQSQRAEWLERQKQQVHPAMLRFLSTVFNGNFEDPERMETPRASSASANSSDKFSATSVEFQAVGVSETFEKAMLQNAIPAAQSAFREYRTLLKNGEYYRLATHIIDKKTYRPLQEEEQRTDAVVQAFHDSRDVLETVGTDFKVTRFEIVTHVNQANPKLPAVGEDPFLDQRSITVKWTIPGSAAGVQRWAPEIPRNVTTLSSDGDMIVYMKWINGKWYWLPLGW